MLASLALLPALGQQAHAQGLQVAFGAKGIQTLSYNGVPLENVGAFPSDAFHIWHMQATDLAGNSVTSGQYGWGEDNNGESWNSQTNTETYNYTWGTIATQFVQSGNNLNVVVTETNYGSSGIIFNGAEIYPFALHFPKDPASFSGYSQWAITTTGPGVSTADYGLGIVTAVIPNESVPLYTGWLNVGAATYAPILTSTAPSELPPFQPHLNYSLKPGSSLSYTISLRFTPEGTPANAADAYASFAETYPSQMTWTDKRILGTAYLASSPNGSNITQPGGYPTNPRRYFNDPSVNITTPAGLQAFQDRMLAQAENNVTNAQNMDAQGVITWDIEGEEYPQTTSYVCSPDQIAAVAPEMESTITDRSSAFYGQKLDDAYFRTMSNAGLRVGLCLRPQVFTLGANSTASQVYLASNAAIIANLEKKASYANSRWGATMFYVDSTVDSNGGTLDPAIFQQLITDFPGFLFIPEESTPRYYAYTAPFYSFIDLGSLGTASSIYNVYPKAFGANLVNDANPGLVAQYTPQLTSSVEHGDILMGHADYWQANDPVLLGIIRAAGITAPSTPSTPGKPTINWPTPAPITYGTALSAAQLNASASVAGTFQYSQTAGAVLGAGANTLSVTFTPGVAGYTPATSSVTLRVNPATAQINWPNPAPISSGTALTPAQLNATSNIPGTFTYSPALGTVLSAGTYQLSVTFTPKDSTDYSATTGAVSLTVNAGSTTPAINWPNPAAITYGSALNGAQLDASANVPGNITYSPGPGTVLTAGAHTLTATLVYSGGTLSATRVLTVNKATPQITWAVPAPITSGTALTFTQLNASANVSGTFKYTPAAGTVLNTGNTTLSVQFTPVDTTDYNSQTATVTQLVNAAATGPVVITSPGPSATVSGNITVTAQIKVNLDAAGSFLMVDGREVGSRRVVGGPFIYPLNTATLSKGQHTVQVWAHDINNSTMLSSPVVITVAN